jgi:hypothetical protein
MKGSQVIERTVLEETKKSKRLEESKSSLSITVLGSPSS